MIAHIYVKVNNLKNTVDKSLLIQYNMIKDRKEMIIMLKKKVTLLAALGLCLAGVIAVVSAATVIQKVESELRPDFTIVVDGEVQTFKNAQGETVYPMLYDGTTYLPVRAIGELMGKTVYWYEDEKRVELKTEQTTVTDADVIVPGGTGGGSSSGQAVIPQEGEITLERAKEIALERAGLSEADVTFTRERLEVDDGVREYDIEFYTSAAEYSADISAADGTIRSWDVDEIRGAQSGGGGGASAETSGDDIGLDRAKEIALERAGLSEADVTFTETNLDRDDGRLVYEIEFRQGRTEYSAEILASDGTVVSWDVDYD